MSTPISVYPLTLYYDASCPLCKSEMTNLMLRNTAGLLRFVDASAAGFVSPLPGRSVNDLMQLIHAKRADGGVVQGVEVFRLAYSAVGMGWVTAPTRWPVLRQAADAVYPWIARHRHRLPRSLVALLFEGPVRRAADKAAARAHCDKDVCER
jgi:predicted DCC family thiol-disulfide oxidoreductase YuxK